VWEVFWPQCAVSTTHSAVWRLRFEHTYLMGEQVRQDGLLATQTVTMGTMMPVWPTEARQYGLIVEY
jgi:hypothetical protein